MSEPETLTFDELANWSRGRWLTDQQDAADNIMLRAIALAEKKNPNETVVRNETTGELRLVPKAKK